MNDIFRVDDHYYLTATYNWWDSEFSDDNTIVRCRDLEDFADGGCVDLKDQLGDDGAVTDVETHWDCGPPDEYNDRERERLPKQPHDPKTA